MGRSLDLTFAGIRMVPGRDGKTADGAEDEGRSEEPNNKGRRMRKMLFAALGIWVGLKLVGWLFGVTGLPFDHDAVVAVAVAGGAGVAQELKARLMS